MNDRTTFSKPAAADTMPHFVMRFSPISGVNIQTNMPKEILVFELEKFCLDQKLQSPPFEAYHGGQQPGAGLTGPA